MRVLTFTTLFPNEQQPGHAPFVRERVLALAKLVDLRVVAPVPWFPPVRMFGDRYFRYAIVPSEENLEGLVVEHPRFPVIPKLCKALDAALLAAACLPHLLKLRNEFRFEVIDAHWAYPDGAAAALLAKRLDVPFAVTLRGDDINVFLNQFWRRPWIRWSLRRADLVIALSKELKQAVVQAGVSDKKVAVIPNGINQAAFRPVDRALARAHLGIPNDARVVLSVGRLHQSKGFSTVIEAAGRLFAKFQNLHVYVVGPVDHEADARPAMQRAADRYGIADRLHIVGPQDSSRLRYWYSAADVFCLATEREGSANVLLEAMACGLPCITTPVGGNPEVVNRDDVGILAAGNAESMAGALDVAFSRSWNTQAISAHGRARTWQTVAVECREQLAAAVENRRRVAAVISARSGTGL